MSNIKENAVGPATEATAEISSITIISSKFEDLNCRFGILLDSLEIKLAPIMVQLENLKRDTGDMCTSATTRPYSPLFEYYMSQLNEIETKLDRLQKIMNAVDL